jgi:hypothetical protein
MSIKSALNDKALDQLRQASEKRNFYAQPTASSKNKYVPFVRNSALQAQDTDGNGNDDLGAIYRYDREAGPKSHLSID